MTDEHAANANPDQTADARFDDQAVDTNLSITHPFDPAKIKVTTIPALIDGIIKRIDHQEIDLEPSFQRRARLWDIGRKSRQQRIWEAYMGHPQNKRVAVGTPVT